MTVSTDTMADHGSHSIEIVVLVQSSAERYEEVVRLPG